MPEDFLKQFGATAEYVNCIACDASLTKSPVKELVTGPRERGIFEAQTESMGGVPDDVWFCESCRIIYPVSFTDRYYRTTMARGVGGPDCPTCDSEVEMIGHATEYSAEKKILVCRTCTYNRFAISIFGFRRPMDSDFGYFSRLRSDEVLERLEYVEGREGGSSLAEWRDMFDRDPEYVLAHLPDPIKPYGFVLAYAYDYDAEEQVAARREDVAAAIAASDFEAPTCPFPRRLKGLVLKPEKVLLDIVPRRGLGSGILFMAAAVLAFAVGVFPYTVPVALIGLLGAFVVAFVGVEVRTTGWKILCEDGLVSIEKKSLLGGDLDEGISRIEKIEVQVFCRAPMAHTYVDVSDPEAKGPPGSEMPVVEGLRIHHHGRTHLLGISHNFEFVLWAGRALLEGAKAQGVYVGPH